MNTALILLGCAVFWFIFTDAPGPCDTDAQCAQVWQCRIKPGCDGSPATEPFDFRLP